MNASWKTTLCGIVGGLCVGLSQISELPAVWVKIFMLLGGIMPSVGLLFARDNGVTSEQAGAKAPAAGVGVKLGLIALLCFGVTGCKSPYQAAGVTVVTADHAADAWADYVVWQKKQPAYDVAKLARQENEVRTATLRYQAAMETVYFARNQPGQTNAPPVEAVLLASQNASASLVNLILSFLPPDRAATLKTSP